MPFVVWEQWGKRADVHTVELVRTICDMFCPNCGAQNEGGQHFCRMCGLGLDAISAELTAQNPSPEMAMLLEKQRRIQRLGVFSLSIAGIIGLCLLLAVASYYKLAILGPELLFGSAIGALIFFLLVSTSLFAYSKYFMKVGYPQKQTSEPRDLKTAANRLLDDPPFEPAIVTEQPTELLRRK